MSRKLVSVLFLVFCLSFVSSVSEGAINVSKGLDEASLVISEMVEKEIPVESVNELFYDAKEIYDLEVVMEGEFNRNGDFSQVVKKIERIFEVSEEAFVAKDELEVFLIFFGDFEENIDVSSMYSDRDEIVRSFEEERFSDTVELIEVGYEKLYDLEASQTALRTFYDSTSKSIRSFFVNSWKVILVVGGALVVLFFVFRRAIVVFFVRRKVKLLKFRKESILNLIKETQRSYFDKGKMSAEQYKIKVRKFEEMIRDIDRQLPVLKARMRL